MAVLKKFLSEVENLVDQPFVKEPDKKISDLLKETLRDPIVLQI